MIEVCGKSTRKIHIIHLIFLPEVTSTLDLLLRVRNKESEFVSSNSASYPMLGCPIFNNFTEECPGLHWPELTSNRSLRKYIASTTQLMNLTETELKLVADHLGHSLNVHADIYTLKSSLLEKTKVARLLLEVEQGSLKRYDEPLVLEE